MAPSISSITPDHESITWPIASFAVSIDFKSTRPAHLLLDRANAELGLIYQTGPGIAVMAQFPDTDEPIYFQVSKARAACTRFNNTCKKVCILMQHFQLDLIFTTDANAADFLQRLGRIATKVGNLHFEVHEAASVAAITRSDFNMEKEGYTHQSALPWMAVMNDDVSEWARIYKAGKCTDFIIEAGGREFPVHRVLLSIRSQYFNAVCDGRFAETEKRSITLPEDEQTVSTMLQEIYEVYNPTNGSLFTNFALRRAMEKDRVMIDLLALFIAADKYNLEAIKLKAAEAIIDRLPFIHDPLSIVDLASGLYSDDMPPTDRGLKKAIIGQLQLRLESIMEDDDAWDEYSGNRVLVKAVHKNQVELLEEGRAGNGLATPPASPTKKRKFDGSE